MVPKSVRVKLVSLLQPVYFCYSFAGILCCPCNIGETNEEEKPHLIEDAGHRCHLVNRYFQMVCLTAGWVLRSADF